MRHQVFLLAAMAGAAVMAVAAPPAHAQGICCRAAPPPVVYAPVVAPYVSAPYYIVNQGPVYSGPGIFTRPTYVANNATFAPYPYVYAPGFYAPSGYGPPPYVGPSYRPRGAYYGRRLPRSGVINVRPRYGYARPPVRRPMGSPHGAAPSEGRQVTPLQPQMAPSVPPAPLRPSKPVEEKWTRGVPG